MRALEEFSADAQLDPHIHSQIRNFLSNNYREMFARIENDNLIAELPPTMKEILFYHQYGDSIIKFDYLMKLPIDAAWTIVKKMKKISFEEGDMIYEDNSLASCFFLIYQGQVKLFANNGLPFKTYKHGEQFRENEMITSIRSNGIARASKVCKLY